LTELTFKPYGTAEDGGSVLLFRMENENGAYVEVMNYGCRIRAIGVPDKNGKITDICLGYDDIEGYLADQTYQGAVIGRYANRIAGAQFALNGKTYNLEKNDGANHLHGGSDGFHARVWSSDFSAEGVSFSLREEDGDSGYPGALDISVAYTLSEDNKLSITYSAKSDSDTVVNFTNHTFFNLEGETSTSILDHELQVFSDAITEADAALLPTGGMSAVAGTPFDFNEMKLIGRGILSLDKSIKAAGGYDHNYCVRGDGYRLAAILQSKKSGIRMSVYSDQPGIQIYTSNMLNEFIGKKGRIAGKHSTICLESQHYPDSPNIPAFPSTILKKGEEFITKTEFVFEVLK